MGLSACKPENPHVRDRARLLDGLAPLRGSTIAAAGDGRFAFIIGDKMVLRQPQRTEITTFLLDYVDLVRGVRTRLEVGGWCNFGMLIGFYAVDECTVVLVDYNEPQRTLRQRLVTVDVEEQKAHAWLDRGYALPPRALFFIAKTAVCEDRAITLAPSISGRATPVALVYPKHPLDTRRPARDISALLAVAAERVRERAAEAAPGADALRFDAFERLTLSAWDAPFFMSATTIGFFTDKSGLLTVDPALIVVCDIESGQVSLQRSRPDPATNFPYTKEGGHPFDFRSFTGSHRQLGAVVSHRCPADSWRRLLGNCTDALSHWTMGIFVWLTQEEWRCGKFLQDSLAIRCLSLSIALGLLKYRLLRPPGARLGLLDTRSLQWRELPRAVEDSQFTTMKTAVFGDGHTLIYDRASARRVGTRDIGGGSDTEPTEELRILSNPSRMCSLKTLAEMRLRKTRMNQEERRLLSDRI